MRSSSTSVRTTLVTFLTKALSKHRPAAFAERLQAGAWRMTSSTDLLARAERIAAALHSSGVERGDAVAVIGENGVDWIASAFGTIFAAATLVPVARQIAADQLAFILEDANVRFAFVHTAADAARVGAARASVRIVMFGGTDVESLATFERRESAATRGSAVRAAEAIETDDVAVLVYTSGSTGEPRGVELSHAGLTANAFACTSALFGDDPAAFASFSPVLHVLPLAHIYALSSLFCFLSIGADQYLTTPDDLLVDLADLRPRSLPLVPRIYEKLLATIHERAKAGGENAERLSAWALALAKRTADTSALTPLLRMQRAVADRFVFARLRARLGLDRMTLLGSGSAMLHRDLAMTFAGMGLPITEGYGMTEAGPAVTVSHPRDGRFGSVGRAIPGVLIRTAADGEIEVRSPGLMIKYHHPVEWESPFTRDGWYRTGDVGEIDVDGYLRLTDRKGEMFKTSTGHFVAPSRVEAAITHSAFIAQAAVVGSDRAYPIALVCPNWALVREELELPGALTTVEAARLPDVCALLEREVAAATTGLAPYERTRRIAALPRELSIERGELSSALKPRRRVIEALYGAVIDEVYARAGDGASD